MNLETPIQYLKGVGPKMAERLSRVGVKNINDLVFYFPRAWNDLGKTTPICHLRIGENYNIRAKITEIANHRSPRKRMNITSAIITDSENEIRAVWFNQPFLAKNLKAGETWIFSGKVEWDFQNNAKVISSPQYEKEARILSVYPETEGLTSKYLRKLVKSVIDENVLPEDYLPKTVISEYNLMTLRNALREIHFPGNSKLLVSAKKRLAFDELFIIALRFSKIKKEFAKQSAPAVNLELKTVTEFVKNLSYRLTNAQRKVAWEILKNTAKPIPMNRLLEGDVGSGKTVVAVVAALNVIKNGYQVVWMAPTEILATQHFENVSNLLKNYNINISLITSNQATSSKLKTKNEKRKTTTKNLKRIANSELLSADLIIGTHALIQDNMKFNNLGLVIIDEQHRFGVKQRARLTQNSGSKLIPHFLSMTATPIPRTLALSAYGDLEISVLDEKPPGRQNILTRLVDPTNRNKAYKFIRDEVEKGNQVFVICPLIEEKNNQKKASDKLFDLERKSVKKEYEKLSKNIFPDLKVGLMHGKMKPKEKENIMTDFKNKNIDILVSTSVVEVGVDIPNATIMMIEDSDRFGLAQLHQFRGRVGRGQKQSYCLLFTNSLSPETHRRLNALVDSNDGFKLAEKDLEIRGPGEFAGVNQHGLADLKMASLTDIILINHAKNAAEKIISDGLEKYPHLLEKISRFEATNHLE